MTTVYLDGPDLTPRERALAAVHMAVEGYNADQPGCRVLLPPSLRETIVDAVIAGLAPPIPADRPKRELKPCGTYSAYMRHRRHGDIPCDACRAANAEKTRAHAAARRAARGGQD